MKARPVPRDSRQPLRTARHVADEAAVFRRVLVFLLNLYPPPRGLSGLEQAARISFGHHLDLQGTLTSGASNTSVRGALSKRAQRWQYVTCKAAIGGGC